MLSSDAAHLVHLAKRIQRRAAGKEVHSGLGFVKHFCAKDSSRWLYQGIVVRMTPAVPNLYAFASDQETAFALIFTSLAESIRYTRCSTVAILTDGKPVKTQGGRFTRGTAIESAGLEVQNSLQAAALAYGKAHPLHLMPHAFFAETVTAQLDADAVAQLGAARTIEFRICNDETSAPAEFVQATHEFVCRLGQRPTPPTPSAAAATREPPRGLCPALVVERLKARGLSLEAIQEICKP